MKKPRNNKKEYFVEFDHITSGIRAFSTLLGDDYILFVPKLVLNVQSDYKNSGINMQSLIVKVKTDKLETAHHIAFDKSHRIMAYLAGIYQVPFFFTLIDSIFNYNVYSNNPVDKWEREHSWPKPLVSGMNTVFSVCHFGKDCALIKELPNFEKYSQHEDIFYLWRSATDLFNELGWRFLNYIRIIELITKGQRGGKRKVKEMYDAFSENAKKIITPQEFMRIIVRWGHPVAHGNIPNAVIPRIPRGNMNQDPDAIKLNSLTRELIKNLLNLK